VLSFASFAFVCASLTNSKDFPNQAVFQPEGVTCLEDWASYLKLLDDVQQPLSRVR
jgi:hypothetical protein